MFELLVIGLLIVYAAITSLAMYVVGWFKTVPFEATVTVVLVTNTFTGLTIIFLMMHGVL